MCRQQCRQQPSCGALCHRRKEKGDQSNSFSSIETSLVPGRRSQAGKKAQTPMPLTATPVHEQGMLIRPRGPISREPGPSYPNIHQSHDSAALDTQGTGKAQLCRAREVQRAGTAPHPLPGAKRERGRGFCSGQRPKIPNQASEQGVRLFPVTWLAWERRFASSLPHLCVLHC